MCFMENSSKPERENQSIRDDIEVNKKDIIIIIIIILFFGYLDTRNNNRAWIYKIRMG